MKGRGLELDLHLYCCSECWVYWLIVHLGQRWSRFCGKIEPIIGFLGNIRPTFGSNASPWSWSLIKVHQPLLEASLPFPGPHDYTCFCHDSLYQNTFAKDHLCKWISFWFQCIFGTHSCYRHPHLSYLQKMDCYHQEGGLQNIDWLWCENSSAQQGQLCRCQKAILATIVWTRGSETRHINNNYTKLIWFKLIVWTQQLQTHHI